MEAINWQVAYLTNNYCKTEQISYYYIVGIFLTDAFSVSRIT